MNHNFSSNVTIALLLSVVMPPDFSMASEPSVRRHFGMDAPGNDRGMWIRHVGTVDDCENICLADPGCAGYTYNARRSTCIPKNRIGPLVRHSENPITGVIFGRAGDTAMHSEVSPAGEPGAPQKVEVKDGIYCVHPTSRNNGELADGVLAVRQELHDALEIGLLVSYPERNGAVSALGGLVKKVATNHWLYLDGMDSSNPDDHCAVDMVLDQKGWHFTTRKAAKCINDKGHDAVPASLPIFALNSYVGQVTNQLDKPENLTNINCSLPYTPARETPGAPAHAKSVLPAYVGRWMDNPTCRPPFENELKFSTHGMDGDELSCRFDRIRGGSGRWHIRMTCHGEGGTERREVDILVDGNTMQFKEGGETSKKTRCP